MAWAYYNEFDPFAAEWLENLMAAGLIPSGDVDTRSIVDVRPEDLEGFDQCHFFAGIAGWPLALRAACWPDDEPVWTGSCPCQPFSAAGKRKGTADERHLWPEFHRLIAERRPPVVLGEQVASKDGRQWLAGVRADVEALGYALGAADLCAAGAGAPHIRQRLFWVADANRGQRSGVTDGEGCQRNGQATGRIEGDRLAQSGGIAGNPWSDFDLIPCLDGKARRTQPGLFPLAHGVPARVGRLRAYGNAVVHQNAADFICAYREARG